MINGHGDDLHLYPGCTPLNFSSNILSGVDHTRLMARLAEAASLPSSYPDPDGSSLARLLGPEGTVEVTAGAVEAIYLIALSRRGSRSVIIGPTFREYEDACRLHGHTITYASSLPEAPEADIIWLCNPNNPTGRVTPHATLLRHIVARPRTLFVVDQAYAPYTTLPLLTDYEAVKAGNVVLLSSLTKRYSVPGLRIGYAIGAPALMSEIKKVRMPWSVNAIALEGARWLIAHSADYPVDAPALHAEATRLRTALISLGIEVEPTDCNFILCLLTDGRTAADLKQALMEHDNILIRDASNFHGLTRAHFRVAAQTPDLNDLLIQAIARWLNT